MDEARKTLTSCYGVSTLHVGRVRDFGLTVVPDIPKPGQSESVITHAEIQGVAHPDVDLKSALLHANYLASEARLVWP